MNKRIKNPVFLLALFGLIYTTLKGFGINIPDEQFKTLVDLISYAILGYGIYKSY